MNEFTKQALSLCGELTVELKEVLQVFDDGVAFCGLSMANTEHEFLMYAELHDYVKKNLNRHDVFSVRTAFFYTSNGRIYKTAEEFLRAEKPNFAPEMFLYATDFTDTGSLQLDSLAFVSGKVVSLEHISLDNAPMLHVKLSCLGFLFDMFFEEGTLPFCEQGNIIRGVYDVIGVL